MVRNWTTPVAENKIHYFFLVRHHLDKDITLGEVLEKNTSLHLFPYKKKKENLVQLTLHL